LKFILNNIISITTLPRDLKVQLMTLSSTCLSKVC